MEQCKRLDKGSTWWCNFAFLAPWICWNYKKEQRDAKTSEESENWS